MAATPPTDAPIVQLKPGKDAGTFHFVRHAKATLTIQGKCELVVSIRDALEQVLSTIPVADMHDFMIEADLRPGTYWISIVPTAAYSTEYSSGSLYRFHIDKSGRMYCPDDGLSQESDFIIVKELSGLSPARGAIAESDQPTLTWPAVLGAVSYEGSYGINHLLKPFTVRKTQYVIWDSLPPDQVCLWTIRAFDSKGKVLASGAAAFYAHGTKPATLYKDHAETREAVVQLPVKNSYLGIHPMVISVPKKPAAALPDKSFIVIPAGPNSDYIPGIRVVAVASGSPAIDAGLLPDDVIVAIDDHPVAVDPKEGPENTRPFTRQISDLPPGTQVKLKVRRFPKELTLSATIGRFSPEKSIAPATAP